MTSKQTGMLLGLEPRPWVLPVAALSCALIFVVDALLPLGIAEGVPYVIPILMMLLWNDSEAHVCFVTVLATAMIAAGGLLPHGEGGIPMYVLANRGLVVVAVWVAAGAVGVKLHGEASLARAREREAAMQQQESLARLGAMAAVVAHEVKNPLAGISGALDVLGRRMEPPDQAVLDTVQRRIRTLTDAVDELLEYAEPRRLELREVEVEDVMDAVRAASDREDLAGVQLDLEAAHLRLRADPGLLAGALTRLVLNAAQAGGDGRICVCAREEGDHVCISVADDGPGVLPERRDEIFEPFFTTRTRGTGLGLPLVRRVAEQHGGVVELESPPGGGAVFHLHLPADLLVGAVRDRAAAPDDTDRWADPHTTA